MKTPNSPPPIGPMPIPQSYTCPKCGRTHMFPMYYYAGVDIRTDHKCTCGKVNTLLRFKVVK